MIISPRIMVATLSLAVASAAFAQPTPEEIKQLGTTLTPWGAEIAGNKEGTIPAYTGGVKPPPGSSPGESKPVDPYPGEKPLFSITNQNLDQYADKLTVGTKVLFKRFPEYRIDVYPTHRSFGSLTDAQSKAALANANNPQCSTSPDGVGLRGCWGATPFPIPKTGYEAMWNALTHQVGTYTTRMRSYFVDSSGSQIMTNDGELFSDYPYWDQKVTPYQGAGETYYRFITKTVAPSRDAGQKTLIWYPLAAETEAQRTWSYTTGQRRTRLAPELSYDTPAASLSGAMNYDEIGLFAGRMDRFDFKLVGRQEMYVPYNQYKYLSMKTSDVLGKQFVNPEAVRWELHRVWVVKATRKAGVRHIAAERNFYIDEDSWTLMASDATDDAGKVFRVGLSNTTNQYLRRADGTAGMWNSVVTTYDLNKGQYLMSSMVNDPECYLKMTEAKPDYTYRSESMAGTGVR